MTTLSSSETETLMRARATKKRLCMWWAIVSACWALLMMNMSFSDLKYSLEYHLYRDRIEAAYQTEVAAYETKKQEGQEQIRLLLKAAHQYEQLQFLSLAAKRSGRAARATPENGDALRQPQSEYRRILDEIAALEKTYGKVTLRKYREADGQVEQALNAELRQNLIVPHLRQPRLAAILFHMIASPLALLFALWIYLKGYRRLAWLRQIFRIDRA